MDELDHEETEETLILRSDEDEAWIESAAHEAYKRAVAAASEDETVHGEPFPRGWRGQPHRTLESGTTERWDEAGRPAPAGATGDD